MQGSSDSVMKKVCKATMYVLQFKNTFMHVTNVSVDLLCAGLVLGTEGAAANKRGHPWLSGSHMLVGGC